MQLVDALSNMRVVGSGNETSTEIDLLMLTISTRPVVRMSWKHIACRLVHASGHGWCAWLRRPTKGHYLWWSWTVTNDSKHIQASFSLIPTDWLRLRVAQNPRSQDLVIFMVTTTDRQTDKLITLPLCMHVGNNDYVLLNCMGLSATSRLLAP